jgi:hypothetical protein
MRMEGGWHKDFSALLLRQGSLIVFSMGDRPFCK